MPGASSTVKLNAKSDYLKSRVNLPTNLSSRGISETPEFNAKVRAHCFFSAKVAESRILDRLRYYSDQYSSGKIDKNSARAFLKNFLRGQGFEPDGAITDDDNTNHSTKNLASTARLNLILNQNKLMATTIGRKEEISRLGAPYQRYVPSWKREKREDHKRFYNTILPVDHAFWDTHTPPLDFNCGCGVEPVWDEEEAKEFGGISSADVIDKNADTWTLKNKNGGFKVESPESGFVFNSAAPFEEFDLTRIKDAAARGAMIEDMEAIFGDQVSTTGKDKLKFTGKPYKDWRLLGLKSAKAWATAPVPPQVDLAAAKEMLKQGVELTAVDGEKVILDMAVMDHWKDEKKPKLEKEINSRLVKINAAIETVKHAQERWDQEEQSRYLKLFKKDTGGLEGCLVAVEKDGTAKTYFIRGMSGINNARNGLSYEEFE